MLIKIIKIVEWLVVLNMNSSLEAISTILLIFAVPVLVVFFIMIMINYIYKKLSTSILFKKIVDPFAKFDSYLTKEATGIFGNIFLTIILVLIYPILFVGMIINWWSDKISPEEKSGNEGYYLLFFHFPFLLIWVGCIIKIYVTFD